MSNPSIFDGDGRLKVEPTNTPEGTRPATVTKSAARRVIEAFTKARGRSQHSGQGATVWIIVQHCKEQGIEMQVEKAYGAFACVQTSL